MARYGYTIKSKIGLSNNYGSVWADADADMEAFRVLLQANFVAHSRMQTSKILHEVEKEAIDTDEYIDRKYVNMTFCDSAHTDKKFYMKFPCCLKTTSAATLGAAIAALGLKFKVRGDATEYNLDTYVPPKESAPIDDFVADA